MSCLYLGYVCTGLRYGKGIFILIIGNFEIGDKDRNLLARNQPLSVAKTNCQTGNKHKKHHSYLLPNEIELAVYQFQFNCRPLQQKPFSVKNYSIVCLRRAPNKNVWRSFQVVLDLETPAYFFEFFGKTLSVFVVENILQKNSHLVLKQVN